MKRKISDNLVSRPGVCCHPLCDLSQGNCASVSCQVNKIAHVLLISQGYCEDQVIRNHNGK